MKFSKLGRNTLAAGISLVMGLGLTACSRDYTAAYIYAPSASGGAITAYGVDYQTGILNQISGSPFTSQLKNPISAIPSPNGKYLYEIGGDQDSKVEVFSIGTDGKLYGQQTPNITGTYPTGAAVDTTGTFLYVTYEYQIGYGPASTGPGGVTIFPIQSDGTLGTAVNVNLDYAPVGIAITAPVTNSGNAVFAYVAQQETTSDGVVTEYQVNTTTGNLTAIGSIHAGVNPSAIIVEPTARYVYVSDKTSNQIYGFQLSASGTLSALSSSPYSTDLYPLAMTIDPRGKYLYTANYNGNTVSGFTINHADGSLGAISGTGTFKTSTGPRCVVVDPAVGNYLYTANYLDNSVSGAQLKSEDGTLSSVANTPFTGVTEPSCVATVPNGDHALSYVYPN
ncbi:MAG: beta-propeller fold lactonase family protein [Acidobacteriaceae bacterium]|nr:beta-propeller fold lactonase family protein [Acidobacteriaceae bacterium]